jgi:hypothetical protein
LSGLTGSCRGSASGQRLCQPATVCVV